MAASLLDSGIFPDEKQRIDLLLVTQPRKVAATSFWMQEEIPLSQQLIAGTDYSMTIVQGLSL
jgi:hypothetical protein